MKAHEDDMSNIIATNLTAMMVGTKTLLRCGYMRRAVAVRSNREGVASMDETLGPASIGERITPASETDESTFTTTNSGPEISQSPSIINLSSLLALRSGFGAVSYSASKAGVLGFTRALASEYSMHRVRVNAIVPGYIETDMTSTIHNREGLLKRIPLGRFGTPEEVAGAALFLAENEYACGSVVSVDGGLGAM